VPSAADEGRGTQVAGWDVTRDYVPVVHSGGRFVCWGCCFHSEISEDIKTSTRAKEEIEEVLGGT
jgi:hypothetical protein